MHLILFSFGDCFTEGWLISDSATKQDKSGASGLRLTVIFIADQYL